MNWKNNLTDVFTNLLKGPLNIDSSKTGKTLLYLNAIGIAAAAVSNTFAAATDKNTSAEDKKFLVPAGLATGVANLGIYFTMTDRIINSLQGKKKYDKNGNVVKTIKGFADNVLEEMQNKGNFDTHASNYIQKIIKKAEFGFLGTGLFKKPKEEVEHMKAVLKNGDAIGDITDKAKELYKDSIKSGFGVMGAFIGAVIGSAILTPILRDISAYIVQKHMEKKNPSLKDKPYMPYFEPTRIASVRFDNNNKKQPLTMKSYMISTGGRTLKV